LYRGLALAFVLTLVVSSLIMVESASAQTIPKPSVPVFTIETVSFPYDVPPTTTTAIDPYTGKETVTTQPGYHVENKTTEIRIKNQSFNGPVFYNIRLKGHFSQDWGYYRYHNGSSDGNLMQDNNVAYTLVPIDAYLPSEGQVDFQIEALTGYEHGISEPFGTPRVITGETSGWSNIQTLTIPDGTITISASPNPTPTSTENPTPTPTIPEFSWLAILPLLLLMLSVAVLSMLRRKRYDADG
jgi:hypothetical protein